MKCQHCGKKEANFYYRSTVNGRTTEKRLCSDCAEELGYGKALERRGLFSDEFFARPFGLMPSLLGGFGARMLTEFPAPAGEKTEMHQEEESLLTEDEREELALQCRRNALQNRLKEAVAEENYEEAARLRDELRGLSA